MVATDQRLVGRCAVEGGHARLCCLWHVQIELERPFRMQEADRRVDHDVAGEEHFFAAGTDMLRDVSRRVTGGVEGRHAWRHLGSSLGQAQPGGPYGTRTDAVPPPQRSAELCQLTAKYSCSRAAALVAELKSPGRRATSAALGAGSDRSS